VGADTCSVDYTARENTVEKNQAKIIHPCQDLLFTDRLVSQLQNWEGPLNWTDIYVPQKAKEYLTNHNFTSREIHRTY
jgi:hypothetical protein